MKELNNYIIALVNLYGLVHRYKVMEIYNSQNTDKISNKDLDNYFSNTKRVLEDSFVGTYKNYCFEIMLEKKSDKPFYIPEKEELLKYADGIYFERNKEYKDLLNYMKENFFDEDRGRAESLAKRSTNYISIYF